MLGRFALAVSQIAIRMTHLRLSYLNTKSLIVGMKEGLDIRAISIRHVNRIDKLYRMHGGLASVLVSYQSVVIELEIRHSSKWGKPPDVTARQLAECWRKSNPELSDAVAFVVHIYEISTSPGFSVPAKKLTSQEALDSLFDLLKAMANKPEPDILLAIVRGRFGEPTTTKE